MSPESFDRLRRRSLVVGALALLALLLGALFDPERFFRSYLLGYLPWISLSLGALAVLMLQHVAAGAWGFVIRRLLEAATRVLPLLALLFLPIALGVGSIYEWAHPVEGEAEALLEHKDAYLNVPFFLARAVFFFAVWIYLSLRLHRLSRLQDERGERFTEKLQSVSGPGLILYALTVTFAWIDWTMSLDMHWYSTIYGMRVMVGQALAALAFSALVLHALAARPPFRETLTRSHFHALGNMILAFVMLWAYMAFSEYLIIWSGNLPEEIRFYLQRSGSWLLVLFVLVVLHFGAPFLLLLSRGVKAQGNLLAWIAGTLFLMRFVDTFWLVVPSFHPGGLTLHWMDVAATVGVGGVWLWAFGGKLLDAPLLPRGDERFEELLPSREVLGHGVG